jgi:hypothetical protein
MASDPALLTLLVGSADRVQHDAGRDSGRQAGAGRRAQRRAAGDGAADSALRPWTRSNASCSPRSARERNPACKESDTMSDDITRVEKPWGYELHWAKTDRYVGKLIHVNAGTP